MLETFKIEIQKGDQTIQLFCRIGYPQKLGPPSLIFGNLRIQRKLLINHAECIEI